MKNRIITMYNDELWLALWRRNQCFGIRKERRMEYMKEQNGTSDKNFLKGTLILTVSSIVVKVIGSLNWIILSRVLGGEGIGLYQMGFPIYLMAITVSSAGIPVAISIVTSEKLAHGDYRGAKRIFNVSLRLLFISGLVFSSALWFGAGWLIDKGFILDGRAYYSIIALAPAVFFVTFLASFRGYLQGWQIMTPTAVSEIVEQLMRVVTMLVFAELFLPYGLAYAAGGASMGAGVGAFCALLVLMWFYRKLKLRFKEEIERQSYTGEEESAGQIIKRLLQLALPVSLSSLMLPIGANLDLMIVPQRLAAAGFNLRHVTEQFGYLTGMAVPLINLATIFTAAMTISLVPAISAAKALNDHEAVKNKLRIAFRAALIITFPCFMGLYFLAEKVAELIYNAPGAAGAIQTMSIGILFLGLHQISTGILQGLGKTVIPVVNMIVAALVKVGLNWWLTAMPELGIKGAALATATDFLVAMALNMFFIYKLTGYRLSLDSIIRPLFASGAMGGVISLVLMLTGSWGAWSVLAAMLTAVPVYALALLGCGGLTREDLEQIPFLGRKMLALGIRTGVLK
ncbi:MAG: polysaccharide biosynthesis protein [Acidaminococcaceae bacterium]|nr:polysaccharide biosynthesis protein [Acidaminococcaceae bacterium]